MHLAISDLPAWGRHCNPFEMFPFRLMEIMRLTPTALSRHADRPRTPRTDMIIVVFVVTVSSTAEIELNKSELSPRQSLGKPSRKMQCRDATSACLFPLDTMIPFNPQKKL